MDLQTIGTVLLGVFGTVVSAAILGAVKGIYGIRAELVDIRGEIKAIRAEMGLRFSEGERRFEMLEDRVARASENISKLQQMAGSNGKLRPHGR